MPRTLLHAPVHVAPRLSGGFREARNLSVTLPGAVLCLLLLLGPALAFAQHVTVTGQIEMFSIAADKNHLDAGGAVVWLLPLGGASAAVPANSAPPSMQLLQKHKSFTPHLLIVQAGSIVEFPNDDPFFHNVFSLFDGKRFDLGLYEAGKVRTVKFDRPGICYIFCNIHPEMSAVVVVLRTPYYGVSDASGRITIANVPPGRYEQHVWHERSLPEDLNQLTREITISDSAASLGMLRLKQARAIAASHKNKYGRDYEPPSPSNPVYVQP